MLSTTARERQLEPRYRRVLSFGDVLDESIGLFRRHWSVYASISAVCLLPPGLLEVAVARSGALNTSALLTQLATGTPPDLSSLSGFIGSLLLVSVVSLLFALAWAASVLVATDDYAHASEPTLSGVFVRVAHRYPIVLLTALVSFVAISVVFAAASALFFVSVVLIPILIVGALAAIVGIALWWLRPSLRSRWLKWLIVLATPLGLGFYFAGSWALSISAVVLEHRGPISGMRRSRELVDRHWFRAVGILLVASAIVSVLQYVSTLLVQVPLTILALMRGEPSLSPNEMAISIAANIATQILFASMASISYAVLFIDLRNRREATDIAERLSQLEEVQPLPADD
jgi:hypothetical protein